jgi:glycosyltransferase involved in cell wall biosynthesis
MSAALELASSSHKPPRRSALRRLWQRLPQNTRRQILFDIGKLLAPHPDRAPLGGWPLGIAGLFSTASGLGEGARLAYAALDAAGQSPTAFNLSSAFGQAEMPAPPLRELNAGTGGTLVVHHNGPYFPHALWALGRAQVRSRRIIGYWAWELPKLPAAWHGAFPFVHEIWVPSTFIRDAVAAATDLPVHVVPHPLPNLPYTPNMRAALGLPADALMVLNVFHLGSAFSRKNPIAAVKAFRHAFGDAPDRVLAIKLVDNGAAAWARRELDDAIAGASNIRIIDGMLAQPDMTGLMAASDIVISLHRSEGFGLVPAEAMRLGKPVVATGWSGNLEFMTETNSALVSYSMVPVSDPDQSFDGDGQSWAEADVEHAASWLRRLADSAELRQRMGAAAQTSATQQLSPARFARTVETLLHSQEA